MQQVSNERDWSQYASGKPFPKSSARQSAVDPDVDMSLLAPAAAIGQAHRVAAHPRRRTGSKTAAAREMAAAAAAAEAEADDSSELSDLDSPGDGSEVEDNFEDVWAVAVTSPSAARSRYSKPEDEGVVQYRRYCADLGCVPISYYEMHYADGPVVMNDHGIGGTGGVALAKSLAINEKATSITLRTNALDEKAGKAMAAALEANTEIVEVDLFENQMQSVGFAAFSELMASDAAAVKTLDFGRNDVLDFDALPFSAALKENTALEILRLRGNKFGDFGAGGFASMLRVNSTLQELDLSENRIRKRGALALASALAGNAHLKRFNLGGNGVGSAGGVALADAVGGNSTLEELKIDRCEIESAEAGLKLAELLQRNKSLKHLDISYNHMPEAAVHALLEAWEAQGDGGLAFLGLDGIDIPAVDEALIKKILGDGQGKSCSFRHKKSLDDTKFLREEAKRRGALQEGRRAALLAAREAAEKHHRKHSHSHRPRSRGSHGSGSESSDGGRRKKGKNKFRKRGSVQLNEGPQMSRSERRAKRESEHIERRISQHDSAAGKVQGFAKPRQRGGGAESDGSDVSGNSTDPDSGDEAAVAQSNWRRDSRRRRKWSEMYPDMPDPMEVLEEYVSDMQLRLVDLFFAIDKDRSGGVTASELATACKSLGLDMGPEQKEELMLRMDSDGDGLIDYHELCEGRRRFANKLHAEDPRWKTIEESDEDDFSDDFSDDYSGDDVSETD